MTSDLHRHVRGESIYIDDLVLPAGTLHAAVVSSPVAHGTLQGIDAAAAQRRDGVVRVLTASDIPGENQIGTILSDEPLLAADTVHFVGEPVAVVLAETAVAARQAAREVTLAIAPLPPVLDAREAAARGQLLQPARTFAIGDVDAAWGRCAHIVKGCVASGGQEHFYLETQGALAEPRERGQVRIVSATQAPTAVQRQAARVLGLPMHAIEVDVRRLGGAFGGKEDQATPWAVICALGVVLTGRPVRLVLDRREDLLLTGKRHPYSSDYCLGIDADGRILAYEVTFYQNAGATADLSTSVLERSLFHATGSYHVPNVRATGLSCRTNLPPFTAFRGFGGPQAMIVMEAAIEAAARAAGLSVSAVQRCNLVADGDTLPYGMTMERCHAARCWDDAAHRHNLPAIIARCEAHNRAHAATKKGVAVMPVCFGISFTNIGLNQAGALVHVYQDGSVGVSTGAVEMGQGVNLKIQTIVATTLGVDSARVSLESTNTSRVANTSPTAASSGADLNGEAAHLACLQILARLRDVAARELPDAGPSRCTIVGERVHLDDVPTTLDWTTLVQKAYWSRTDLSAHAHHATPDLHFDRTTETGRPFAYHVHGTAITEVTLDVLRGTAVVDAVKIVHDGGRSLDVATDRGQVEGGLVQGLGWLLLEEVEYDAQGRLRHDTSSKLKIPDLHFAPATIDVTFLADADNPHAVMQSKAVGEPPLMYGIGGLFALRAAIRAARPDLEPPVETPLTPERTLLLLASRPAVQAPA